MRSRVLLLAFVLAPLAAYAAESTAVPPQQSAPLTSADERAALHNGPDWALIAAASSRSKDRLRRRP